MESQFSLPSLNLTRRFLAYKFFTNLWFVSAVWLYFYRLFVTDQQVGILDSAAFALGLLAEIPSGALADRFGRSKLVKVGQCLVGIGLLIQVFGASFLAFFIGQSFFMIGVSFASGADEALFFEKFNFDRASKDWRNLLTLGSQTALVATLLATIIGGWLHGINPQWPWILTGLSFFISVAIIWPIQDSSTHQKTDFSSEVISHLKSIKDGILQFAKPELWLYIPIIITVQALFYACGYGMLKLVLLDRFHFDPFMGSIAVAICALITIGVLSIVKRFSEKLNGNHAIITISMGSVFCLLLSIPDISHWGFIVILGLYAGERILYPFISEAINLHAPNQYRATTLSVASFLRAIPYVFLGPIIGTLNTQHHLEYFLSGWAILIVMAILYFLRLHKFSY